MKLYHLDFICGFYDSAMEYNLGVFSSEERRELAIEEYRKSYAQNGTPNFIGYEGDPYEEGEFRKWESELDKNIYELDANGR